jgi:large subunit ribosomal protein L2
VKPGNAMPLASIPVGTIVHNVEMRIGKGRALARSAGTYAQIVGRDESYVSVRLKLGEQRLVHGECFARVGAASNPDHMNISTGKSGRNRWLGRMPHNRGVSMNLHVVAGRVEPTSQVVDFVAAYSQRQNKTPVIL